MPEFIPQLERLIEQFQKLPGIGRKTAIRLAFHVIDFNASEAAEFAAAVTEAKASIRQCARCFNISVDEFCPICVDEKRDGTLVCVVEDYRTVMAFEKVREFRGVYHVLHGAISPVNGVGPEDLNIAPLMERLSNEQINEVIIATNPTIEGETTAMYLTRLIKPLGIKITRPATGIPVGGDLEYADEVTLFRAIENRRPL